MMQDRYRWASKKFRMAYQFDRLQVISAVPTKINQSFVKAPLSLSMKQLLNNLKKKQFKRRELLLN